MATGPADPRDDDDGNGPGPGRRWRVDDRAIRPRPPTPAAPSPPARVSGRRVVGAMVAAVLTLWLGLDLAFRGWRARHQARAEFGATRVAPAIDPLAEATPPGVPPLEWRRAVADTHAMLLALTGSGFLDESRMDGLRREIASRVVAARPETARVTLAGLWDDLERDAGPLVAADLAPPPPRSRQAARHPRPPRPPLLGPSTIGRRPGTERATVTPSVPGPARR